MGRTRRPVHSHGSVFFDRQTASKLCSFQPAPTAVWFGIQVHVGGGALKLLALQVFGGLSALDRIHFLDYSVLDWLAYGIFLAFNLVVLLRGMETLKRFELWAAPLILVFAVAVCIWACMAAGGLGPVIGTVRPAPPDLGSVMAKGLVSIVAFWSTLGLNSPDFSRFAKTQRDQMLGQALGLPTTMVAFSILGILTSSAMAVIYGKVIWNPLDIIQKMPPSAMTAAALVGILIATVCVNVPANLVSPAYDFSNLAPRRITFWRGALVTAALATAIMPWRLLATAGSYIFNWLGTYGDLLGPVAGILIVDYWVVRRKTLVLTDLYRTDGAYGYVGGFNPVAIVALTVGVTAAAIGKGVPALSVLSDYGWFTGVIVGGAVYGILMKLFSRPESATLTS